MATKDMAYLLGMKQQSLNELLKKFEKNGYVKRKPSKEDKRVMIVCLTEEGEKVEQKEEKVLHRTSFFRKRRRKK
nr:MarR family transcriptional regulator [uncultured Anaerostipes sp.]